MKILDQTCVSADIVIKETIDIKIEYKGRSFIMTAKCEGNSIITLICADWHSGSIWNSIVEKEKINLYKLIEKALNKTL